MLATVCQSTPATAAPRLASKVRGVVASRPLYCIAVAPYRYQRAARKRVLKAGETTFDVAKRS
jgi:hypothetical protein